ncbi:hypothetical protein TNIN_447381 [Trichonephila inaurata madagascariensis]|uniref:Uncharacterized protein n=1 Tax=Trichonephila inaurata madagascariensis TaxID=2747483 RepID=A0A8X6MC08_9ARAC|nr:hypothetical protein TNIN_447381 [Trichonephila inaurata madagascariensis]
MQLNTPRSFHLGVLHEEPSIPTHMILVHDLTEWVIRTLKNTDTVKVIHKKVMTHHKSKFRDSLFTGFIQNISVQTDPPTSCRNTRSERCLKTCLKRFWM